MITRSEKGTYIVSADELNISTINRNEASSTCPLCREHRGHPNDHSLKVNVTTGEGYCHHCHESVFVPDYAEKLKTMRLPAAPVRERSITEGLTPLDDVCRDYLEKRNLSPEVAVNAGVGSIVMHGVHYLAFPFMENSVAVNIQYKRADGEKKEFKFVPGGKIIPWNINCLTNGNGKSPLYITEGMMDALALIQSGYENVVSVPNGAGSKMTVFDDYRQLIKHNFTHIVFAGDNDKVGEELRDKVKKYFDDMDVSVVTWQWADNRCKDANDMLVCGGTDAVAFSINNARYDDCGYFDVMESDDDEMMQVYEDGVPDGRGIGLKGVDNIIKYLPGYMYLFSGFPGAGKSSFINYVTMRLLKLYGWRSLYFTPEKLPKKNHRIELVSVVTGKKFDKNELRRDELQIAMNYLSGNVIQMREDISRDIDVILHAAELAIRRYGIKVMVIDPFLYIDIKNLGGLSETTKISQMLCKIRMFAQYHDIVMIVVAHPRKPNLNAERPRLSEMMYEVAGSSGFFNFCDVGVMLERVSEKNNILKVQCGKSRFSYLGKVGETTLMYNPVNGRYADCTAYGMVSAPDYSNWSEKIKFYDRGNVSDYVCNKPF